MVVKLWLFGVYREVYLFHDVTLSYFAKWSKASRHWNKSEKIPLLARALILIPES